MKKLSARAKRNAVRKAQRARHMAKALTIFDNYGYSVTGRPMSQPEMQDINPYRRSTPLPTTANILDMDFSSIERRILAHMNTEND